MNGTVVLPTNGVPTAMALTADQGSDLDYGPVLKTVNIYRLSRETLADSIIPEMEEFIANGRTDQYYEAAFAKLIESGSMNMAVMMTDKNRWAEIDTLEDLSAAGTMFDSASATLN